MVSLSQQEQTNNKMRDLNLEDIDVQSRRLESDSEIHLLLKRVITRVVHSV